MPLPTADEKAEYVLNQFNRIARGYDLTNDAISFGMHRLWKKRAVQALRIKADGSYLDVCCGTGDLTTRIAAALSEAGSITGLDFSNNMLTVAQARQQRIKMVHSPAIQFVEGNALQLPFRDHQFDGAIISFGLRNLADFRQGLAEMARVIKPGGRVVNLDLGRPTNFFFKPIYYFYFCHIVPIVGQLLQNDKEAYTYLPNSLDIYPSPTGISQLFAEVGLQDIKYIPLAMASVALHIGTKF